MGERCVFPAGRLSGWRVHCRGESRRGRGGGDYGRVGGVAFLEGAVSVRREQSLIAWSLVQGACGTESGGVQQAPGHLEAERRRGNPGWRRGLGGPPIAGDLGESYRLSKVF